MSIMIIGVPSQRLLAHAYTHVNGTWIGIQHQAYIHCEHSHVHSSELAKWRSIVPKRAWAIINI
jgi:hypothetical protein